MGSFCSKTGLIFAASSINDESITDFNDGEPIHVGLKEFNGSNCLKCKDCKDNKNNNNNNNNNSKNIINTEHGKKYEKAQKYGSSEDSDSEEEMLYDHNGKPIRAKDIQYAANNMGNSTSENADGSDNEIVATLRTRSEMQSYWAEHSNSAINKSLMLLMEDNPSFEEIERTEICSYLPKRNELCNMDCIELGAGIGRFTNELGKLNVKSLLAIDFVEKFIRVNEDTHKHLYPNINMKFKCQDVTTLVLNNNSFDFVFSNWLMMYLDDLETFKLCEKMYKWCKNNGYVFFRESCEGGASGDKPRTNNPTYYRKYEMYTKMFDNVADRVGDKKYYLKMISMNKVKVYVDLKNKTNQFCWLYQKIERKNNSNNNNNNNNNDNNNEETQK